jgi:elongation factor 1-gamma
MATYTLYAPEASFRAFAALIAAEYNDVGVEISTDLSAASLSPTGKLPLLEITKGVSVTRIFSSHAIARYMAGIRRDTGLMGNNITEQAAIDAWIDFTSQDLELPACVWFYPVS